MKRRSILASFELVLLVGSLFAFSYFLSVAIEPFEAGAHQIPEKRGLTLFEAAAIWFVEKAKSPLIPRVVAQAPPEQGCCSITKGNDRCSVATKEECAGEFVAGVACKAAAVCQKGCCSNDNDGTYVPNVAKFECPSPNTWSSDATCASVPGAQVGCCFLNGKTGMLTERKCEIATKTQLGEGAPVTWKKEFNTAQCRLAALGDAKGACQTEGDSCVFNTAKQCADLKGIFSEGYLCTADQLNTSCKRTTQTTCVGEKVHFLDSCGNPANIYDAKRAKDSSYWQRIVAAQQSCGAQDEDGNALSKTCGNCNKLAGGMCANALTDDVDVTYGDNYCAQSFCQFKGEQYKDGESWCVYDGAIGNGDDVVGSRHWRYVCSQGEVQVEPCADARQGICTQTSTAVGTREFREAHCVKNNWRACLALNRAADSAEQQENMRTCAQTTHCRVEKIAIADKFRFEMCTPKYPAGVHFTSEAAQNFNKNTCGLATQTCTVVRKQKFFGGCEYVANKNCLSAEFGQQMNDLCRGLGDCGGEVNIEGQYTANHQIRNAPALGGSIISALVALAKPIKGQYAETERYEKHAAILGVVSPGSSSDSGAGVSRVVGDIALGLGATGAALGFISAESSFASLSAYSGPFIGASAGAYVGLIVAQELGLSPAGAVLMAIGGTAAGVATYLAFFAEAGTTFLGAGPAGWIVFAVITIVTALFFGGSSCDPIEVSFECKPWQPPKGGADCESCNTDPLKPCSKYRCESLGAACTFVNDFKKNGLCIEQNPNDETPPKLAPIKNVQGSSYTQVSDSGFKVAAKDGSCVAPRPLLIGVTTNEPAKCRVSANLSAPFTVMQDLGSGVFGYNHSLKIPIPDPSHGRAMGHNWTGSFDLRVRCQDPHGNENPQYTISMCVVQGDDDTPTTIEAAVPKSGSFVRFAKQKQEVRFSTYELATCKWDTSDVSYDAMKHEMTCADELFKPSTPQGYLCTTEFPLNGSVSNYFIRCKDQPWLAATAEASKRNENIEGISYTLKRPTQQISIESILPSQDLLVKTPQAVFDLEVITSGGAGMHLCKFSTTSYKAATELFVTGASRSHKQPNIRLAPGNYNLYVECRDETGDVARDTTSFEIIQDASIPLITRVTQGVSGITFETAESATCKYSVESCGFAWTNASTTGTGREHTIASKKGQTYFIRCEDGFGNRPNGCSIAVQAV